MALISRAVFWLATVGVCAMSLASFRSALHIAFGVLAGLAIGWMGLRCRSYLALLWLRNRYRAIGAGTVVGVATLVVLLFAVATFLTYTGGPCGLWVLCSVAPTPVQDYALTITLVDLKTNSFRIDERMIYRGRARRVADAVPIELPARDMFGARSGFFLRHLVVPGPAGRHIRPRLPNGKTLDEMICGYFCPATSVELRGFPARAFYTARAETPPTVPSHPGTVTIRWQLSGFYSGRPEHIEFWYHPTASPLLIYLFRPLADIASLDGLILTIGALVVSAVIGPFVLPAIQDIVKGWLKKLFAGSQQDHPT